MSRETVLVEENFNLRNRMAQMEKLNQWAFERLMKVEEELKWYENQSKARKLND